jgi:hypothetical protein
MSVYIFSKVSVYQYKDGELIPTSFRKRKIEFITPTSIRLGLRFIPVYLMRTTETEAIFAGRVQKTIKGAPIVPREYEYNTQVQYRIPLLDWKRLLYKATYYES